MTFFSELSITPLSKSGRTPSGSRFGVQAEVLVARESRQYGVGNAAHADLKRGAVGDQFGDVAADPAFDFGGCR